MEFLFWFSFFLLFYIYFGYPLAIKAVAAVRPRPVHKLDDFQPKVSILIAAFNEAKDIEATLCNKLEQDYPKHLMEILVISDESDDGTDQIVETVAEGAPCPVYLYRQVPRQGKTAGLNTLYQHATGDILLFSDANSQWDPQALQKLVSNFSDPEVGYVTGKMVYVNKDGSLVGDGCSAYMKYENWLRYQETLVGSVVGVDGGIDAMRKSLYQPLRADQLPDFVQPLKVVEQGARVVYEPEALLKEEALSDSGSEFSMRVRVSLRALSALKDMAHVVNPVNHGLYALQLHSHKLLRYYAFIPLALLAITNTVLASDNTWYLLAFIGQAAFYLLAWCGHQQKDNPDLPPSIGISYYFVLLNTACLQAALAFARGEKKVIWDPRKG